MKRQRARSTKTKLGEWPEFKSIMQDLINRAKQQKRDEALRALGIALRMAWREEQLRRNV